MPRTIAPESRKASVRAAQIPVEAPVMATVAPSRPQGSDMPGLLFLSANMAKVLVQQRTGF